MCVKHFVNFQLHVTDLRGIPVYAVKCTVETSSRQMQKKMTCGCKEQRDIELQSRVMSGHVTVLVKLKWCDWKKKRRL